MQEISILLADSQYLIRQGLRHVLSRRPNFRVLGEAESEEDLMEALLLHRPNLLIFDYNQPRYFSADSVQKIKSIYPGLKILVISADSDRGNIYQVLENGINSFLTKTCGEDEIIDAVKATMKGEKFFCTKVLDYLLEKSFGKAPEYEDCSPTVLTPREIEIVHLTAKGLIAKEIANELCLSTHTVYTHRKNIMKKLKVNSASELVLYAVNNGLLERSGV